MTGAELIIPILIGVSCTLNIAIITGGKVTDFRRWLMKNWYHITYVDKISCDGNITNNFIIFSYFINFVLSKAKNDSYKKYSINIDNQDLNCIPTGDCLEVKMQIDGNRQKELNLSQSEIVFWIITTGVRGSSPNGYELWINYPEQVPDVYRLLTLFFRFNTNCPLSFMNFTTIFRISNDRLRYLTYNEVILDTKQNIKLNIKKGLLSLKGYNYPLITNSEKKFNQIESYFNDSIYATNRDDMYLGICIQNKNLFFDQSLTQYSLRKFINDTRKYFLRNEVKNEQAYITISSLACIYNFKSFIQMKFNELNQSNRIDKAERVSSIIDIKSALNNYTVKSFFCNILKQYSQFPILNQILLILYLEYNMSQNEEILKMDFDDIVCGMFNSPIDTIENQENEQVVELTQLSQNVIDNLVDEDEDDEDYSETVLLLKKEN